MTTVPFWGVIDATTEWCEANYAIIPYVAEFFNSFSSLFIVCLGLIGLLMSRRYALKEKRFFFLFTMLTLVGVGSFVFHGTLRRGAQALDEIPMLFSNLGFLYCLIENRREITYRWLPFVLSMAAILAVVIYFQKEFTFFLAAYTVPGLLAVFLALVSIWRGPCSLLSKKLFKTFLLSYGLGFVLWSIDNHFCAYVEKLYLHAWWHLLAGFGTYCFVLFFISLRLTVLNKKAELHFCFGVPYLKEGLILLRVGG